MYPYIIPRNLYKGGILEYDHAQSEIKAAYQKAFGVSWWHTLFGLTSLQFADQTYRRVNLDKMAEILEMDRGDNEEYVAEAFDCEVPVGTAYGLGLFYADGSCGLREDGKYGGAFWRIVNSDEQRLKRVSIAFEQQWTDMRFPLRQYPDYAKGSKTNYGIRTKTLYCLEVAPRIRSNNGIRGMFIEKFRATIYDKFGNKKVPAGILESPPASKKIFLEGVIDGDGTPSKTNYAGKLTCHGIMQATELIDLMLDSGWKSNFGRDNGDENYWITFRKGKKLRAVSACDDYAFALMGAFHRDLETAAMPIFVTWVATPSGGHALISFYYEGEVVMIEPQNDEVFSVPENWTLKLLCG